MRYMTAYDEDILTNPSFIKQGVVIDKLIEALIVSDVNYKEIAQIDKEGLILSARILSYGSNYPVQVTDPKTKKLLDRDVDLTKITSTSIDIESDENGEFDYTINDIKLKWKFLPIQISSDNFTVSEYLSNTICEINGSRNQDEIDDFIRYSFLARDSKEFQKYIIKNTPSLNLDYKFEGENGSAFSAGFQIGPNFFWP